MQRVVYTNSVGESIELYREPFFLTKIEGLADVESDITTQRAPRQNGSTPTNISLKERHLTLDVHITKDLEANRETIARVFNPIYGEGLLTYENGYVTRSIKVISDHVPKLPDERPRVGQKAFLNLTAYDPYWKGGADGDGENHESLVVWVDSFMFPLELPTEFSVKMLESRSKLVLNKGSVPAPIRVVFEGPATSPISIKNITTGEQITVRQNLLKDEQLEITTGFGDKKVTKIGADGSRTNVFQYITLDSSFFNLIPGNNRLEYSLGAELEDANVDIYWTDLYSGI